MWNDGRYNGWVERKRENKIQAATFGSAMHGISKSIFIAEASLTDYENPVQDFDSLEKAVAWVHKTSNGQ